MDVNQLNNVAIDPRKLIGRSVYRASVIEETPSYSTRQLSKSVLSTHSVEQDLSWAPLLPKRTLTDAVAPRVSVPEFDSSKVDLSASLAPILQSLLNAAKRAPQHKTDYVN